MTAPAVEAAALLSLAGMHSLMTDAQRAGQACPWCNETTGESGIDLGERHLPDMGTIHPVACRSCVASRAREDYAAHCRTCVRCHYREECTPRLLLRRLALETRL
ncbi:hypothetical protein [Streptomyces rochei]|uniref:hypothetical protein n=1 Tax=Streptomyces rochei TaxID=1928 RepID=UPI0036A59E0B